MEGKEVTCTCRIFYRRLILISGILSGILLVILGITTISGDTANLFPTSFFKWYVRDIHSSAFNEEKGFSWSIYNGEHTCWARQQDYLRFEWTTRNNYSVIQCNEKFGSFKNGGMKSDFTTHGKVTFELDKLEVGETYYFCRSFNDVQCSSHQRYHMRLVMFKDDLFRTNGYLGNQNYRWTFFMLAVFTTIFGIIMVLGELHVPAITTKFTFFYFSFVKGLIYISIGFLLLGMSNILGLAASIVIWVVGILNCIYGWGSVKTFNWSNIGATGTTTIVTRREYI